MRSTTKCLVGIVAFVLGTSIEAQAQAPTSIPGGPVTSVLTVVVPSFVRIVTVPADPATGAPGTVRVVTNDPRIRAAMAATLTPETIAPEAIAFEPDGGGRGGESSLRGHTVTGPTTIRYTFATP